VTILLAGGGTGGHVFPLIAVADALRSLEPELRIVFVGTERGIEKRVVPDHGYELELVRVLPIRGAGVAGALRGIVRAASAIPEARALLRSYAPSAVFSIGGYAAGPIALAAKTCRIPLALIEPNSVIGLSNRLIAPFAARAYTAFAEADRYFEPEIVLRTGVPLRVGFEPKPYERTSEVLRILVLGGSQGAKALNEVVPRAIARAKTWSSVVHQSGNGQEQAVRGLYRSLGKTEVKVVSFIDDMPAALAGAELVIGRSGASALSEVCAVGRPSLLIPYPHAAGDHQLRNAESLAADGAALCVPSRVATAERIADEIDGLVQVDNLERMALSAQSRGRPKAALAVARDLLVLASVNENPGARRVA